MINNNDKTNNVNVKLDIIIFMLIIFRIISFIITMEYINYCDLTKIEIDFLRLKSYKLPHKVFPETQCMICFDDFDNDKHEIYFRNCGHSTCLGCFVEVLSNCNSCPCCKVNL
jgi:hypothetical protein